MKSRNSNVAAWFSRQALQMLGQTEAASELERARKIAVKNYNSRTAEGFSRTVPMDLGLKAHSNQAEAVRRTTGR